MVKNKNEVAESAQSGVYQAKPRVAFISHTSSPGGAEIALLRLVSAMPSSSSLVVLGEEGVLADDLRSQEAPVVVLALPPSLGKVSRNDLLKKPHRSLLQMVLHIRGLVRLLRESHIDIVHTNTLKAAIYGGLAGRIAGLPVVVHVRDRFSKDYMPWYAALAVRAYVRVVAAATISISAHVQELLFGRVRHSMKHRVVFDPIPELQPARPPERQLFCFALVGRISPWKGQRLFIEAFAQAFRGRSDVVARVVGSPLFGESDYLEQVQRLAIELGVADQVSFEPHIADVNELWQDISVCVHASLIPEPFGMVVAEAMSAGLPVLVPDAGGPAEIVQDGVTGLTYALGDADDLSQAMRRVLLDAELRVSLGERARQFAHSQLNPARSVREVVDVYEWLTKRRSRLRRLSSERRRQIER